MMYPCQNADNPVTQHCSKLIMGELYWAVELSLLELTKRMVPLLLLLSPVLTRSGLEESDFRNRNTSGLQVIINQQQQISDSGAQDSWRLGHFSILYQSQLPEWYQSCHIRNL